jgi:osmotically-inducible protein OsmY
MLLSLVIAAIVCPSAAFAQTNVVDLTASFIKEGVAIENLQVSQISDIVLIRGITNDRTKAVEASRIATSLGYRRVANLIVIVDDASADAEIVYTGQRRLELEPALGGCRFRVDSSRGVVRLTGSVQRDVQAELALRILSKVDGVREIHPNLQRL